MPNCPMARGSQSCPPDVATFIPRLSYFVGSAELLSAHKVVPTTKHFAPLAMNNIPNKFRPSSAMSAKDVMRQRRKYGRTDNYNWQSRVEWYPVGFRLNRKTIFRQFGRLHYLACHSPAPISKKWQQAYDNFHTRHFGTFNGTMRYLNKWSCHSWL
jgi:hypothetical protein